MISGFCYAVDESYWFYLQRPTEYGTDRWSQNISMELPLDTAWYPRRVELSKSRNSYSIIIIIILYVNTVDAAHN
jgi:hypothetical protein